MNLITCLKLQGQTIFRQSAKMDENKNLNSLYYARKNLEYDVIEELKSWTQKSLKGKTKNFFEIFFEFFLKMIKGDESLLCFLICFSGIGKVTSSAPYLRGRLPFELE